MGNTVGPNGFCNGLEPAGLIVKVPQIVVHEADEPDPVVYLSDADELPGKDLAEIDLRPWKQIRPQWVTVARPVVKRVVRAAEAAVRSRVSACRRRPGPACRGPGGAARG